MYSIYVIVNLVNGKCYVGITSKRLVDRVAEHISRAKCGARNNRLAAAMRKYGFENFGAFVETTRETESSARLAETTAIHKYNSHKDGYNCNYGGHGNLSMTDELRRRIGEAQKGKVISLESRTRMSAAKLGNKECADNFGIYAQKGHGLDYNAKTHEVEFPDGHTETVFNLSKFCDAHGLTKSDRGHLHRGSLVKGYRLLGDKYANRPCPRSRETTVELPDSSVEVVKSFRSFCREHGLTSSERSMLYRGRSVKGYRILRRFDGHSERKYSQAGGSGGYPNLTAEDLAEYE